ncbi:phosphatase PAP2 family protein [Hyphomicrobium sp. 99]|uniref:phosphatase PAP2 family protein n=1 Tax=Hyphomicrobium sp. 99 TaxID=1163419 RepID=UPI0005F78D22|nr:phosphatase PAP2 family protein [Hyphomicrobium sp. 99]
MSAPGFAFGIEERHEHDPAEEKPGIDAIDLIKGAVAVGALSFAVFALMPGIDLKVAHLFYAGNGQFVGNQLPAVGVIRFGFNAAFYVTCALTVVGLVISGRTASSWLGFGIRKWLFLALCLLTGPLVVANIGFKDHWGRARPRDVVEFAGSKAFTAPFPPSSQCSFNCSFVSGEASSVFIVLFAAALLFRSLSRNFVAFGILLGGLAGLTRMAQGGHFLSDVIFAGVLMAITAGCMQLLFDTLEGEPRRLIESDLG